MAHTVTLAVLTLVLAACGGPAAEPPTPSPSVATRCGPAEVSVAPRSRPPATCLAVGAALTLASQESALQPWTPLASSDPQVLSCTSEQHNDGSLTGRCVALRPGTATISTSTSAFTGDPHGPPQYFWQLTVTVPG